MLAAPLLPPKQAMLVCEEGVIVIAGGCVIVNVCVAVQLLASVTLQVQVPAVKLVTLMVPSPVGLPGVQL